jgi:DNA primase
MPGLDYRAARALLPLGDVLALLGFVPSRRHGQQLRGPCPLHGGHAATSRSFAAHLGKNAWHCFRCGAGGNALDLWAAVTRQPLHAAVCDLCARLGRDVPWLPRPRPLRPAPRAGAPEEETMHDP